MLEGISNERFKEIGADNETVKTAISKSFARTASRTLMTWSVPTDPPSLQGLWLWALGPLVLPCP